MNILHLTDLHFTHDVLAKQSKEKWERVARGIEKGCEGRKIDVVAVTGDFSYHASREEFDRVEVFLQDVLTRLGLSRQQVLMCAGNHDSDTEEMYSAFDHYAAFAERFYGGNPPYYHLELEEKHHKNSVQARFGFVSVNTCHETSLELYERATFPVEDYQKIEELADGEVGILMIHHPPETIGNQDILEKIMDSGKIQLILSGHQHMSLPRLYKAGNIAVIGGMAISPHRKWMAAGCQLVSIKSDGKVRVKRIDL